MAGRDYVGLCLEYLKADALTVGSSADLTVILPEWLQRFSLAECKPGAMDALLLSGKDSPRNLREILDQTALLSPGGILIFQGQPADFRPGDLSGSGLSLRYKETGLVVMEKERQAHHTTGRQFSLFFPFLNAGGAGDSGHEISLQRLSRWQSYTQATFLSGVVHFLLVNDHSLDNAAQHALQKLGLPGDLIHHYRPLGEDAALRTALLHNQARFLFYAADVVPERSWPLFQLALLGEAPDSVALEERPKPAQKSGRHPQAGGLLPPGKSQKLSLAQPFLLSATAAFDLARRPAGLRTSLQKMVLYFP